MPDARPPIIGDAGAFERGAREILARAEAALRASVATLGEVRGMAGQIEAAVSASAGEERATEAINRKAAAAERAAAAIARQNAELRAAGTAAVGEERATAALERRAAASDRLAASMRATAAAQARGQSELFPREAQTPFPGQGSLFTPPTGEPRAVALEREAQALSVVQRRAAEAAAAEGRLAAMSREAAAAQTQAAVAQVRNGEAASGLGSRIGGLTRGYAEFIGVTAGIGLGIKLFHDIANGAKQAQQGVQDLERVIPNVDPAKAVTGFRQLSQEFNVPISDVAQAQMGFGRVTQNQDSALEATRAGLAATKLDAIGFGDSVKYMTVAMQAFHLSGRQLSEKGGVFDQMENVSRRLGVPVGQIIRSFQALPAVANTGGNLTEFIALSAAATRASGRTGSEVNTAFARAATNFIPRNAQAIEQFGIDPNENFTKLMIDAVHRSRTLDAEHRRQLANAIGGPLRGGSTILGLLNRPDVVDQALKETNPATAAGAWQEEMAHVMKRVDTQVQEVGKHLAGLGASFAESGLLNGIGVLAHLLTGVVDDLRVLVDLFNAIPGHGALTTIAEVGGAVAFARSQTARSVVGRFPGLSGLDPEREGRAALATERNAVDAALARTQAQRTAATVDFGTAARSGNEAAAIAARERVAALETREAGLVAQQAALANRTAAEQLALNAAQERKLAAVAAEGGIVGAGSVAVAATATGARMGSPPGEVPGGGGRGLGAAALGFARSLAPIFAVIEGFQVVKGLVDTKGNASERAHGALEALTFGLWNTPITGAQNRAAGQSDADAYIRKLTGGLTPNANDEQTMNARRAAITRQIDRLYAQDGGDPRRVSAEMSTLEARLARETSDEQAAAAVRRARARGTDPTQALLGQDSKQLDAILHTALLGVSAAGDESGLSTAIAVANAYSTLGHRQGRTDLLDKADQAIKATVGAVAQELSDNLALANSQRDRESAYQHALHEADALSHSTSPAARRQGELLRRQTQLGRLQDQAGVDQTTEGIQGALHPGATVAAAERAVRDARREYQNTRRANVGSQATRAAYKKYLDSQNALSDAQIADIEQSSQLAAANANTQVEKDQITVAALQRELARAQSAPHPNSQKIATLKVALANAQSTLDSQTLQDANAAIDAHYQYLEALTNDPLAQGQLEYQRIAGQHLDPSNPNAPGQRKAQLAKQAQQNAQVAHQQRLAAIQADQQLADAVTDPSNTVALARHAETAAKRTLAAGGFATPAEQQVAQANARKTHEDTVRARQQSSYEDIMFNVQIGKYTTDMEVSALRSLESHVKNNRALKRQIEGQIYQLTHQTGGDLSLNLGALRLPSPYEVNRAIREGGASARGAVAVHNHNQVNVQVARREDAAHVARHIDHTLKTSTRSALRAAGVL